MAASDPAQLPEPIAAPLVGAVLGGDYEVVRLLGGGGMGQVYEARHLRLPRRFAIKVIRRELISDASAMERFRREAEICSALGSRHIVEVVDFNTLPDGSPFLVMELLSGEDLASRLQRLGRFGVLEAQQIVAQLCEALAMAHGAGVVHRDIKPENIFLAVEGKSTLLKLLDFGLSKMHGAQRITTSAELLGTPLYMSPEQLRGGATIDHRADLYALGVLLYVMLTGQPPFQGETAFAVMSQIASEAPVPPERIVPDLPPSLSALILRLMEKDPARRPQSATAVAEELERACAGAKVFATQSGIEALAATARSPVRTDASRFRAIRRRSATIAVAVAVAIGVACVAWVALHRRQPPIRPAPANAAAPIAAKPAPPSAAPAPHLEQPAAPAPKPAEPASPPPTKPATSSPAHKHHRNSEAAPQPNLGSVY